MATAAVEAVARTEHLRARRRFVTLHGMDLAPETADVTTAAIDVEPRRRPAGVAATDILPRLRAEPRGPLRRLAAIFAHYRPSEEAPASATPTLYRVPQPRLRGELALPEVTQQALALGFRYLGTYELAGLFGFLPREAWVSADGRTRLSARRAIAAGVEGTMAAYILTTIFDDGTGIETWAVTPPPVAPSMRAIGIGGTGILDRDLAVHDDAVDLYAASHPEVRVLFCDSLDESVAMSRYFDHYLSADETVRIVVATRAMAYGGVVAAIVALVCMLR